MKRKEVQKRDFIKQLRWRLDEAYQQLQQGQFRYALHDTYAVMREALKLLVQYDNHTEYADNNALVNMKICEQKRLFGGDSKFTHNLYRVLNICRLNEREFSVRDELDDGKVRFAIMQIKDLLNWTENILKSR